MTDYTRRIPTYRAIPNTVENADALAAYFSTPSDFLTEGSVVVIGVTRNEVVEILPNMDEFNALYEPVTE